MSHNQNFVTKFYVLSNGRMKKTSQNSGHLYKHQLYKCNGVYKTHKGGLCYLTIHDPTIHDPRMHDSCISYANMLSLYINLVSMICKDLVAGVKKIRLTKEVAISKNCRFLF